MPQHVTAHSDSCGMVTGPRATSLNRWKVCLTSHTALPAGKGSIGVLNRRASQWLFYRSPLRIPLPRNVFSCLPVSTLLSASIPVCAPLSCVAQCGTRAVHSNAEVWLRGLARTNQPRPSRASPGVTLGVTCDRAAFPGVTVCTTHCLGLGVCHCGTTPSCNISTFCRFQMRRRHQKWSLTRLCLLRCKIH